MKSRHARVIHPRMPWAIPGSNVPAPVPWRQQPAQPTDGSPQPPQSLGRSRAAQRMQARVYAATDLSWGEPPQVDPATPAATVWLVDQPVRVPLGWSIAFFTRQGRDCLCLLSPRGELFVLFVSVHGDVRQLLGLPEDVVRDAVHAYFPDAAR